MGKILQLFSHESQLIKALLESDPKAQRHLYEKYAGRMMGVCMRYVGEQMAAEDVLVEGFMRVFEKIPQFRQEGSFEGWIRRIIVNEALGYLRRRKRLMENVNLELAETLPDYAYADQQLEASELLEMMERLPVGYRTVLNLYAIEGYAHHEIAQMLGITEGTSKSQLHRARSCLQQLLAEWEGGSKKKHNAGSNAANYRING